MQRAYFDNFLVGTNKHDDRGSRRLIENFILLIVPMKLDPILCLGMVLP